MNSICLSVAPNLRCEGLTRIENIVLLVPPGIELVFSLTLILNSAADSRRTYWLLVLDGVSFFLLALLDFLSHIIPQASSTLEVFRIIDFVLAGASFVPLLGYSLFLFFFARSYLISILPTRFRRIVSFALYATIPPMLASNELGSLLGIKHSSVTLNNQPILVIGFSNTSLQRLSLFFSAATLALLTLLQASTFFLSFARLVRAFLDERRVEAARNSPDAPDEIHLFRGLGWLAIGLKLSAIESVVGFANSSFGVVITRRALRLLGRGAIIIAVIKGMNVVEDFVRFDSDVRARRQNTTRRSKRFSRFLISNPRTSTFREMSPQASSFHAAQREKKAIGPSPLALGANSTYNAFQGGGRRKERVTVLYDGKTPPVLEMRFSAADLNIPLPALPASVSLPTVKEERTHEQSHVSAVTPWENISPPPNNNGALLPIRSTMRSSVSRYSERASDSLEVVHDITGRFPTLPPPRGISVNVPPAAAPQGQDYALDTSQRMNILQQQPSPSEGTMSPRKTSPGNMISPTNSIKRKPMPIITQAPPNSPPRRRSAFPNIESRREREYATRHSSSVLSPSMSASDMDDISSSLHTSMTATTTTQTPALTRVSTLETALVTPATAAAIMMGERVPGRLANRVMAIEAAQGKSDRDRSAVVPPRHHQPVDGEDHQRRLERLRRELRAPSLSQNDEDDNDDRGSAVDGDSRRRWSPAAASAEEDEEPTDLEAMEIRWLHRDPLRELTTRYPLAPSDVDDGNDDDEDTSEAVLDEAWRRAGLTRIKTVSRVRVRTTPLAEEHTRTSLFAVEEDLGTSVEEEQSVLAASARDTARLDSEVLGEEERRLVRQGIYT